MKQLLDFIAQPESGGNYDIVWGGINGEDRPPKPLTQMTVREVLAWQDRIDPDYMSEAAGRYQIIEDTLRGLYRAAGVPLSAKFDEDTQDKLAVALLKRRGLDDYLAGDITATQFANALAKEWASLPVVSGEKRGRSYYGGDDLNASHVSVDAFMEAVRDVRGKPERKPPENMAQKAKQRAASPAAGAAVSGAGAVVLENVPVVSRLMGGLAPTAQIIAVVVCAAFIGYMVWRQAR